MADNNVELGSAEEGRKLDRQLSKRPSRRMKQPSKVKTWRRGLETGPIIAAIVAGFVFIILGLAAILTGPSCACDLATSFWADSLNGTTPSSTSYSQGNWTCVECPWVWGECSFNGVAVGCQRGCVMNVGSSSAETFCLAPALLVVFKEVPWVNFSVLQKTGLAVALFGLALIIFSLGFAYYKGKQILK